MSLPCYSPTGQKQAAYKLKTDLFDSGKINHDLLKQAYETYLANRRPNLAKTKTRRAVRGGGRKPWRQKGLGLARAGSIRSPLWRGGGVVFGPTGEENYTKKLNKKAKQAALSQALSLKKSQTVVIKTLPDDGKTASLAKLLRQTLKLDRQILLIEAQPSPALKRASRNLAEVYLLEVSCLNIFRILNADWIIFTDKALKALSDLATQTDTDLEED